MVFQWILNGIVIVFWRFSAAPGSVILIGGGHGPKIKITRGCKMLERTERNTFLGISPLNALLRSLKFERYLSNALPVLR